MAATVLNSPRAVQMTVFVVRAFVKMRESLLVNAVLAREVAALNSPLRCSQPELHRSIIRHFIG